MLPSWLRPARRHRLRARVHQAGSHSAWLTALVGCLPRGIRPAGPRDLLQPRPQGHTDHRFELADLTQHLLCCQEGEHLTWEPAAWNKTRLWRLTGRSIAFTARSPTPVGSWRNQRRVALLRTNTTNCLE